MRRHDLLRVDPAAWRAMLSGAPGLRTLPLVGDWASHAWPVIVRRRMAGDTIDGVPAALPLPPGQGKQRISFCLPSQNDAIPFPAVTLRAASPRAPKAWQPVIAALVALGDAAGTPPRVFGALLWQHLTGLPYVTDRSDLDLLWAVDTDQAAANLTANLVDLDRISPVRLDGEIELPDGGAVNWREWAQGSDEVLVKTMAGVGVRRKAALFALARPR